MSDMRTTMLVLTKDRVELLRYLLEFYKQVDMPILIADGSDAPFQGHEHYGNVRYVHRPGVDYTTRKNEAVNSITTEYTLLRSDRRHIFPNGIRQAVDFLDHNPEYSAAHGLYVSLNANGQGTSVNPTYDADNHAGIRGASFAERLLELWKGYVPSYYAVTRTEVWRTVSAIESRLDFDYFYYDEVIQAITTSAMGKVKRLECLYGVDQPPKSTYAISEEHMLEALGNRHSREYGMVAGLLAEMIVGKFACSPHTAEKAVHACLKAFIHRSDRKQAAKHPFRKLSVSIQRACEKLGRILRGQTANRRQFLREQLLARIDATGKADLEALFANLPPPIPRPG